MVSKYWHLLMIDPVVGPRVPEGPALKYKGTKLVGDRIVQSEYKGETDMTPVNALKTICAVWSVDSGKHFIVISYH